MDNLPQPINGTEQYLKAILDELRGIREEMKKPEFGITGEVEVLELKEPETVKPEEIMHVIKETLENELRASKKKR